MIKLDTGTTALIVIDMQVDFCSPTGISARYGSSLTHIQQMLPNIVDFHKEIGTRGVPTYFTRYIAKKTDARPNLHLLRQLSKLFPICVEGTEGAALYKLKPTPQDRIIDKEYYDAFAGTSLLDELKTQKIETVVLAGVWTDMCVDATAKRAFSEGFNVILLSDLVSTIDERMDRHDIVLKDFETYYGFVKTSKELLKMLI